ncbi:alpha/beta hydrolase [Aquimarina sp. 2201CG14-23]|uniref:alpha/beta hydrolase n=1 Tax=Aquimarina mycalae TaxID=3040073 RepID=UPI0024780D9D|nr:dienelactone hydrolase family protein [Aquimarina sp. 2201CG14-23]MDH7445768.1 dienelactone hydrolase family protein [Aquimarina sp. 2201CG14-23]
MQKEVMYQSTNTYDTLNELTKETTTVWLVFHGIGYLSRYFIRLFQSLNSEKNYIIAPQAPSKYYKNNDYKKVGSSWLTKENTVTETKNVLNYVDSVIDAEQLPENIKFVVLGYSQGVSIASRWIANRKIKPDAFVMVSGGFPKELEKDDFAFLTNSTTITHILGEKDPYFEIEKVKAEKVRVQNILPQIEFKTHSGGHELDIETLKNIV